MKHSLKKLGQLTQASLLLLFVLIFKLLPIDTASSFGGKIGRLIGPFLRAHRVAANNIKHVFPDYSEKARRIVLSNMWDNLGRVMGEYPHLSPSIIAKRITVEGAEHLLQFKQGAAGAVFVSGHFANWEMIPLLSVIYDVPFAFIYREANNPYAEKIIQWLRRGYRDRMYGKGRESAQQMLRALRKKECLGLLIDQKMNEGVTVPFFGFPAMTAISAAKLATKFNVPVVAVRVVRTDGASFQITVSKPRFYDQAADPVKVTEDIHHVFESWIRERPEQWFWVHNRWSWKRG
jgi:KDO2-lipid IV(A) lauroyltransferase